MRLVGRVVGPDVTVLRDDIHHEDDRSRGIRLEITYLE